MADVAVDPADPLPRRLDRRDPAVERLRAPRAQGRVAEPGLGRLGQLQAVALVVAPAAQVDRLAFPCLLLHPEDVGEEPKRALGLGGEQLGVADAGDLPERLRAHLLATSLRASERSQSSLAAATRGCTPSSSSIATAASISSTRRAAWSRLPSISR